MRYAIVGYGNSIRNDDSVGLVAVDKIKEKIPENENVGYFYHCNAVDLLAEFDDYDKFILIDVGMIGKEPGEFIKKQMHEIEFTDDTSGSHGNNFKKIMEMANMMGINEPKIEFYLIQPKDMEIGEKIDPKVEIGMNKIIDTIIKEIQSESGNQG